MSRKLCLAIALAALAAAPGCSSCFGGGSGCRRPSFMEFRSPCGRRSEPCQPPMAAPCGPVCDPCGPAAGPGPCCEEGVISTVPGGMSAPIMAPAAEPGTFS
jgi:hypothetical protein